MHSDSAYKRAAHAGIRHRPKGGHRRHKDPNNTGGGLSLLLVSILASDAGLLIYALPFSIGGAAAWKCGSRLMAGRAPGRNGAAAPGQETYGPDTQGAE